jgi:hypothetical protein
MATDTTDHGASARTYTIDELAAAGGVPTRTVRLYQSLGVLHSPQRKGRIAIYSEEHLARLRLRAIRDALRRVQRGQVSFEDWLGLGERLRTPWSEETPLLLDEAELRERIGERPGGFVARLVRAGLVRRRDDRLPASYVVPSPGLLDTGLRLQDAGVDIETAAEAAALLRKRMQRATKDLLGHVVKRTGRGFARTGSAADVGEALTALRAVAAETVRLIFAQEMERTLQVAMKQGTIPFIERSA